MNNNSVPGTSLFGSAANSTGAGLFGQNKSTNPPAANNNSPAGLFGGGATSFGIPQPNASTSPNPTSMFGGNNTATSSQPSNPSGSLFSGVGATNTNKQTAKTGMNLIGASTSNSPSLFGGFSSTNNNSVAGNTNPAGTLGAATTNSINTNTNPLNTGATVNSLNPTTTTNSANPLNTANTASLFGNPPATGANSLGGFASNSLGNNPKEATNASNPTNLFGNTSNNATGATSLFGGATTTTTNPVTSPNPAPASTTTAPFFGNNAATSPTIPTTSVAKPAETANNSPTTAPATSLFGNSQPNNTQPSTAPNQAATGATTTNTLPAGNLFNQNTNKPAATGGTLTNPPFGSNNANTATNAPTVGSPPNVGTFAPSNPVISVPQNTLEADFQKSNQSVDEYLIEYRTTLLKSYEDIKKMAENSLKLLQQREQNQRIVNNFKEIETQLSKEGRVQKKLQDLERKQEQIAFQIEVMSRKVGQGMYTHELSEHLQEYGQLKKMITQMEDDQAQRNDSGHEQLLNIFYSLNQVEMQIREMNQIADVYLKLA